MYPNLEKEMTKHEDTRYDLARLLGITYSGMSYKINGKRTFTLEDIRKICNRYQKPFEYLFATKEDIQKMMDEIKKWGTNQ